MTLSQNLLYLLLLYSVVDKNNKLSPTTTLLTAVGLMLFEHCCGKPTCLCRGTPTFANLNGM